MVHVAAAVEDRPLYPGLAGPPGEKLAYLTRRFRAVLRPVDLTRVCHRERVTLEVVDQLGVDVDVRPVDGEPGALRRPEYLAPDTGPTPGLVGPLGLGYRHYDPPIIRPCRPCAGSARRCSGCPCPCTAPAA